MLAILELLLLKRMITLMNISKLPPITNQRIKIKKSGSNRLEEKSTEIRSQFQKKIPNLLVPIESYQANYQSQEVWVIMTLKSNLVGKLFHGSLSSYREKSLKSAYSFSILMAPMKNSRTHRSLNTLSKQNQSKTSRSVNQFSHFL